MKTVTLSFSIIIRASQQSVFDYVSDWEKQSDWILFTTVHRLSETQSQADVNLLAVTKIGPLKLIDPMVVTEWQSPTRIVIEHTGRLVLGKGIFSIRGLTDNESEFSWQEITPVPFGILGRAGLILGKPLIKIPFMMSLRKLKSNVESTQQ